MAVRVTHVVPGTGTGEGETLLLRLLGRVDRARVASRVICLRDGWERGRRATAELDVPLASLRMRHALPSPAAAARMWEEVRRSRPRVIDGWTYGGNVAAWAGRRIAGLAPGPGRPGVPLVWNVCQSIHSLRHEKPLAAGLVRLGRGLSRGAECIVYVSHTAARQHEALGYEPDRTRVIPAGFDTERFRPRPEARRRWRARLGVGDEGFLVGMVARFHPVKDHATFLRAAAEVARLQPETHFVLAGRGITRESEELAALIGGSGLATRMHLLGEIEDTAGLDAALDVACSSSAGEAFPIAVGEAMATGVPCVVTDVGHSAEVVGDTGRIVPWGDHRRLGEAVVELLRMPPRERARLGEAARRRIVARFSLDAMVERYTELYEELGRRAA